MAWILFSLGFSLFSSYITIAFFAETEGTTAGSELLVYFMLSVLMLLAFSLGALGSLLFPRRGIQDLIAGTELVAN